MNKTEIFKTLAYYRKQSKEKLRKSMKVTNNFTAEILVIKKALPYPYPTSNRNISVPNLFKSPVTTLLLNVLTLHESSASPPSLWFSFSFLKPTAEAY